MPARSLTPVTGVRISMGSQNKTRVYENNRKPFNFGPAISPAVIKKAPGCPRAVQVKSKLYFRRLWSRQMGSDPFVEFIADS